MSVLLATAALAAPGLTDPWVAVPIFVVLFAISFFFSGTEMAFFSLQQIDRQRFASGDSATDGQIDRLLSNRTSLITTVLMGNEFTNVAIATTGASLLAALTDDPGLLNIAVVTPALVLLSEITPKVLALRFNARWVRVAVWPITVVATVLSPVRVVVTAIVSGVASLFGVTPHTDDQALREEEFLVLIERGAEAGVVDEEERDIIEAVFELDDIVVSRLMTPRPDISALPLAASWEEAYAACAEARYSRMPVYDEDLDALVGVLLVKDLLRVRRNPPATLADLRHHFLTPAIVPPSRMADDLMRDLIRTRTHLAFVVDEYGTLMGLVTLDDLIGELVGEMGDDRRDPTQDIEYQDNVSIVRAGLDLDDLSEETGIQLPEGEYHTVAGFLFHQLGRLPAPGDEVTAEGHCFQVVETDGHRVTRVRIEPLPEASAGEVLP